MEILSALLGGDQALQPLKDLLIARTGRNSVSTWKNAFEHWSR